MSVATLDAATEAEMFAVCGSPIEVKLLAALMKEAARMGWHVHVHWLCPRCASIDRAHGGEGTWGAEGPSRLCSPSCNGEHWYSPNLENENARTSIEIIPQQWWGEYRVDFALTARSEEDTYPYLSHCWESATHVLECDGHDWHKTKEQRTADAQRDRYLTSEGVRAIRYTGTEIWRAPRKCAREVLELLQRNPARAYGGLTAEEAAMGVQRLWSGA